MISPFSLGTYACFIFEIKDVLIKYMYCKKSDAGTLHVSLIKSYEKENTAMTKASFLSNRTKTDENCAKS